MAHTNINELKHGMYIQNDVYRLTGLDYKLTANGKEFIEFVLTDNTGKLAGRFWGPTYPECVQGLRNETFVQVSFSVTTYNGAIQPNNPTIVTLNPVEVPQELKNILVPHVDADIETMADELRNIMNGLTDKRCTNLFYTVMADRWEKFKYYPAAQYAHHAVIGGLLQHTLEVVKYLQAIAQINLGCSLAMLLVAAALHDICKIYEYEIGDTGLVSGYSRKGALKGHIVMGAELIASTAVVCGFTEEEVDIFSHLILSHHGKLEFGSPVEPKFLGAHLLHVADDISAKQHEFEDVLNEVQPGCISNKAYFLDNRRLYRPTDTVGVPLPTQAQSFQPVQQPELYQPLPSNYIDEIECGGMDHENDESACYEW